MMAIHDWQSFKASGWRERSTVIGAVVIVLSAIAATFLFSSDQLVEYGLRWAAMVPIGTAIAGFVGMLKRGGAPDCNGGPPQ